MTSCTKAVAIMHMNSLHDTTTLCCDPHEGMNMAGQTCGVMRVLFSAPICKSFEPTITLDQLNVYSQHAQSSSVTFYTSKLHCTST